MANPIQAINKDTHLAFGLQLTEHVKLDHVTWGMHRQSMNHLQGTMSRPLPDVPPHMTNPEWVNPEESILNWKIAANLQKTLYDCGEPLITEFGRELRILRGYTNPLIVMTGKTQTRPDNPQYNKHYTGEALDVHVDTFKFNMFHLARDIQTILKGAHVEIGLIFSNQSWIHVGVNGDHGPNVGSVNTPSVYTLDLSRRQKFAGFLPLRGMYTTF